MSAAGTPCTASVSFQQRSRSSMLRPTLLKSGQLWTAQQVFDSSTNH